MDFPFINHPAAAQGTIQGAPCLKTAVATGKCQDAPTVVVTRAKPQASKTLAVLVVIIVNIVDIVAYGHGGEWRVLFFIITCQEETTERPLTFRKASRQLS